MEITASGDDWSEELSKKILNDVKLLEISFTAVLVTGNSINSYISVHTLTPQLKSGGYFTCPQHTNN